MPLGVVVLVIVGARVWCPVAAHLVDVDYVAPFFGVPVMRAVWVW